MKLEEKLNAIIEKHPIPTQLKLWMDTSIYGFIIFLITSLYLRFSLGPYSLKLANKAFAHTALFLIGFSLILSSICYFWNFADRFIIYRKHLGLVGFGYVLLHTFVTLFLLSDFFPFPSYYLNGRNFQPFVAAVIAFVIFSIMAAVSNQYAIREIGGKHWKMILRTGFIAYAFSIVHFGLKTYGGWIHWLGGRGILPPLDLIVVLFGLLVLGMRISLWIHLAKKDNQ